MPIEKVVFYSLMIYCCPDSQVDSRPLEHLDTGQVLVNTRRCRRRMAHDRCRAERS